MTAITKTAQLTRLAQFSHLPPELEAASPPEARGLGRDEVRLLVSHIGTNSVIHSRFRSLPDFLQAGDVVVINTSGTINAALAARRADGSPVEVHLSTRLQPDEWMIEVRAVKDKDTVPLFGLHPGEQFTLPGDGSATLIAPFRAAGEMILERGLGPVRLWQARLSLPLADYAYLDQYGFPIRYSYVRKQWPLPYYQTVYATEPGSAEMPSAGRAFTCEMITRLVAKGIQIAPLILHTGVASLESHEAPYPEYYRVPKETAQIVTAARAAGRRVIAVGTTVIRALETVAEPDGNVYPGEAWTSLFITPERGLYAVDGLLTGFHEPEATHLAMLEALAGHSHLETTYAEALRERYLWHEFGDLHLILP